MGVQRDKIHKGNCLADINFKRQWKKVEERGRERKRETKKTQSTLADWVIPSRDQTHADLVPHQHEQKKI